MPRRPPCQPAPRTLILIMKGHFIHRCRRLDEAAVRIARQLHHLIVENQLQMRHCRTSGETAPAQLAKVADSMLLQIHLYHLTPGFLRQTLPHWRIPGDFLKPFRLQLLSTNKSHLFILVCLIHCRQTLASRILRPKPESLLQKILPPAQLHRNLTCRVLFQIRPHRFLCLLQRGKRRLQRPRLRIAPLR